jgi:hypothetical protein
MTYREFSPDELRALGDGEKARYVAMLFTPELLALLLEEETVVGNARIVGVSGWTDHVLYDPERRENVPVLQWTLRTVNAPGVVSAAPAEG